MGGLRCPKCGRHVVRRTHRSGLVERLLSRVGVYPFRCQLCGRRFRATQPGTRWVAQPPERREFDRLVARLPASLSTGALAAEGAVTQISMAGCTLETDALLVVGAVLRLRLHLPADRALEVDGAVVRWVRERTVGLEFLSQRADERARLRRFVGGLVAVYHGVGDDAIPAMPGRWHRGALRSADFWFVVAVVVFLVVALVILFPEVKFCPRGSRC